MSDDSSWPKFVVLAKPDDDCIVPHFITDADDEAQACLDATRNEMGYYSPDNVLITKRPSAVYKLVWSTGDKT